MQTDTSRFRTSDGEALFLYRFAPDPGTREKGVVHIAHGMAEHAGRYARLAEALTAAGYVVYADDHRGHGKTAPSPSALGYPGDGVDFPRMMRDLVELAGFERSEHIGLPFCLFGHSMGSYLAQLFMIHDGGMLDAAVLSGTSGKPNALAAAGRLVARAERARLGPRGKSALLGKLSFGRFNAPFEPGRTAFEWLSRDPAEVDKYIADPFCGFPVSTSLWVSLLDTLGEISDAKEQDKIPKSLPIYVFAGSEDPVGEQTSSVDQLLGAFRRAGLRKVTHRYYPGGRHEMVNETNREEVTRDLIGWLDEHLAPRLRIAEASARA
jgi:alpha-beta hydrolase superfamily lysophospholipase